MPATRHAAAAEAFGASPVLPDADDRTRDRVLSAVLENGPVSAAELGDLLGFTPAAVRRHLDHLERSGGYRSQASSQSRFRRRPPGAPLRPQLTGAVQARRRLPEYCQLRAKAPSGTCRRGCCPGVRGRTLLGHGTPLRPPEVEAAGDDITARAMALSKALSRDGFVASAHSIEAKAPLPAALSSVQLCQGHCPIQRLAAEFPVFCDTETKVFSRLVGVDVRRLSTLAQGGHVCTTHIPTGRPAATASPDVAEQPGNPYQESNNQQERP